MGVLADDIAPLAGFGNPVDQLVRVVVALVVALIVSSIVYSTLLQPLGHIPGPFYTAISALPLYYHSYIGDECTWIHALHRRYGPVLRIAPNEIAIADGGALSAIYTDKGGFPKSSCYRNFDIDGHPSIFSSLDNAHRATRAKPVVPMFSTAAIRTKAAPVLEAGVARFIGRIKHAAETATAINILDVSRSLAVDSVTGYLFDQSYDAFEEPKESRLSASPFVDAFVAVGRFFLLPNYLFLLVEKLAATFFPDKHVDSSMQRVHDFVTRAVKSAQVDHDDTYQARMLRAGISAHEVGAQLMDLMFAGTDSTGMALTTVCFHLARNKTQYVRLHDEIVSHPDPDVDPQTLPYLRGVIREGLRLARANPTRFPREVPAGGWTFGDLHLPAGANVGVQNYSLHFGPSFSEPEKFAPERWEEPTPQMLRDYFPFGLGMRGCIAQNLATAELFIAVRRLVESDVLRTARTARDEIEILEWFNSKVKGERVELQWEQSA